MTEAVVQKHEDDKSKKEDSKAAELAQKKKEEEKKAIQDARNELLAPEKVDQVALQISSKNPVIDAKMAEIIAENNESAAGGATQTAASTETKDAAATSTEDSQPAQTEENKPEKKSQAQIDEEEQKKKEQKELNKKTLESLAGLSTDEASQSAPETTNKTAAAEIKQAPVAANATAAF